MTKQEFMALKPNDVVIHKSSKKRYIVQSKPCPRVLGFVASLELKKLIETGQHFWAVTLQSEGTFQTTSIGTDDCKYKQFMVEK